MQTTIYGGNGARGRKILRCTILQTKKRLY